MTQQLSAAEAFEGMIKKIKANGEDITFKIESDSGGEFKAEFDKVLKKHKIEHYRYPSTDAANTALSKVERVNGTPSDPSTKRRSTILQTKTLRSPSSFLTAHPSTTVGLTPPPAKSRTILKTKTMPLRMPRSRPRHIAPHKKSQAVPSGSQGPNRRGDRHLQANRALTFLNRSPNSLVNAKRRNW